MELALPKLTGGVQYFIRRSEIRRAIQFHGLTETGEIPPEILAFCPCASKYPEADETSIKIPWPSIHNPNQVNVCHVNEWIVADSESERFYVANHEWFSETYAVLPESGASQ